MNRLNHSSAALLVAGAVLLAPRPADAQAYTYFPLSGIFGEVEIGASRSLIFTITSVGITPVTIYGLDVFAGDGTWRCGVDVDCDFAITNVSPGLPAFLPTGETLDVEVTFAPESMGEFAGDHSAFVRILSNADLSYSPEFFPMVGRAVEASPEPVTLADLIASFNASVADGSLVGSGPGESAQGRLKALGNMLMAASDLIEAGECVAGRIQLEDVLARTDGADRPPDFIAGTARDTFAAMIRDVLGALVCS